MYTQTHTHSLTHTHIHTHSLSLVLPVTDLRRHFVGWVNPDLGVPLTRGQHGHLLHKLVHAGHQVLHLAALEGHLPENLQHVKHEKAFNDQTYALPLSSNSW